VKLCGGRSPRTLTDSLHSIHTNALLGGSARQLLALH
jgi:hypothetical protein